MFTSTVGRSAMSVAKVIEISATSPEGFEEAVKAGIAKAGETVRDIRGAWVKEQMVRVEEGAVVEFRVDLKVTFVLE
jgi:flavin-binding protein dodecin